MRRRPLLGIDVYLVIVHEETGTRERSRPTRPERVPTKSSFRLAVVVSQVDSRDARLHTQNLLAKRAKRIYAYLPTRVAPEHTYRAWSARLVLTCRNGVRASS